MKEFTFENQGANTYLVYGNDDVVTIDTLSLGMLTNNKISGILPVVFTQMDDKKYFKYNISSKISVKQFFNGAVNKKRLLGVFSSITAGILAAEEYMIETNSLVFDLEYIFADVSTNDASLVCLPILDTDIKPVDLNMFFKNIVFSTQFDQTENCDYVARIISYLNSTPMFSLVDFKKIVDELLHGVQPKAVKAAQPVQTIKPQVIEQQQQSSYSQAPIISKPVQAVKPALPKIQTPAAPEKPVVQQTPRVPNVPTVPSTAENNGFAVPGANNVQVVPQKDKKEKDKKQKDKKQKDIKEKEQKVKKEKKSLFSFFSSKKSPTAAQPQVVENNQKVSVQQPIYVQQGVSQQQPIYAGQGVSPQPVSQPSPHLSFGETTVLGSSVGETTVLGGGESLVAKPFLIRSKNKEKIYLDKPVFKFGKEKSYVDYFIADNTAVSRSHANIIIQDNDYYVIDTNSTNHTFVNGTMLQSNIETKIAHGARICFANEEFEFRLY